jgi:hypothetical protein
MCCYDDEYFMLVPHSAIESIQHVLQLGRAQHEDGTYYEVLCIKDHCAFVEDISTGALQIVYVSDLVNIL